MCCERMRLLIVSAFAALGVLAIGCPGDIEVEGKTFPCRAAGDCVEGYECHPTRFVCVLNGTVDGGSVVAADSGTGGLGLRVGDRCGPVGSCEQGICVDGYCCENNCAEDCRRCDLTPGRCLPTPDGTDPDAECAGREFDCSLYTVGVTDTSCFAGAAMTVNSGTCGPGGVCRPLGCEAQRGVEISRCTNAGCLRDGACPIGAAVTAYDQPEELCLNGPSATCTLMAGGTGCCSLLGACCANDMCAPGNGDCE
jgi:hypothetical protein